MYTDEVNKVIKDNTLSAYGASLSLFLAARISMEESIL